MFRPRYGVTKLHTIKEVIDPSTAEGKKRFKARVASIAVQKADVCEAARETDAAKYVISTKPGCTYIVTSGLHGDVANDNGDFFPWSELLATRDDGRSMYETWINCPVLLNHDPSKRVGTIVDAIPIREEKSVDFLLEVENHLAPMIVKSIKKGEIFGTSMGVLVGQSICNVCENVAYEESDWCCHLSPTGLNLKGRVYLGQDGGEFKEKVGHKVEEINMTLEGVEDSIITFGEPADPEALIKKVLADKKDGSKDMPSPNNANRGSKGSLRSYEERYASDGPVGGGGDAAAPHGSPKVESEFAKYRREHPEIFGAAVTATAAAPKFETALEAFEAITSGKLPKTAALEAVETFRLATASQIEDLSAKQALALLKQSVEDEKDMRDVQAQAEAPATAGGAVKNPSNLTPSGDQDKETQKAKEEDQPTPDGKPMNDGTPSGDQAKETQKAKEEDEPKPEGTVKDVFPTDDATQAGDTNKSKTEANKQLIAKLEGILAQLKNSDMPTTPNGDQAAQTNSTSPDETKPAPKPVAINSGTPNGDQAAEVNRTRPDAENAATCAPTPKTSQKNVKASDENSGDSEPAEKEDEHEEHETSEPSEASEIPEAPEVVDDAAVATEPCEVLEKVKVIVEELEQILAPVAEDAAPAMEGSVADVVEDVVGDAAGPVGAEPVGEIAAEVTEVPVMYAAKLIKDKKNPQESYYVVKHQGKPIFSVSAKQAFGEKVVDHLEGFLTEAYQNELVRVLKADGAKKVFAKHFGRGVVIAQAEGNPANMDALPEMTGPEEPAAGPAIVEDAPLEDMSVDDPKKSELEDSLLDFLQVYATGAGDTADPRQIADDLVRLVASEGAQVNENFVGKLEKMVADKKTEDAVDESPDAYKGDVAEDALGDSAVPTPAVPPAGGTATTSPSPMTAKMKYSKALATVDSFAVLFPVVKARLEELSKENAELKETVNRYEYDAYVKARVTVTYKLADKMAAVGLIEQDAVKQEAVRLAKLSDEELGKEAENLEKSITMATKIKDYTKVEKDRGVTATKIIATIPSQMNGAVEGIKEDDSLPFSKAKQQ